ncbi:MAG: hypothetical protein ACMX3H_10870 [Sodalis sp. (in: enterobacteria)]|uniref:hypothetical protein n=1 Tax=Sodalis sp. (in: enterobacteria) TaxID=1898979 RepID=UPI0039E49136
MLKGKLIFYIVLHALILVVVGFWCMFLEKINAVMIFSGVFLLSIVVSIVIFSIDIGRYQLSTFIVVIEQFKGKIKKENLS